MAAPGRVRGRLGFGPVGPRRRRYTIGPEQLASLGMPVGDDGVVIGADEEGFPAVLGLNRPSPYEITLVGGLWTAQVLALRTAATGARIVVETGRAPAWASLARPPAAAGASHCTRSAGCRRWAPRRPRRLSSYGTAACVRRPGGPGPGRGSRC